jgi:ABC-type antimicrobial peptide transport system permease subunit
MAKTKKVILFIVEGITDKTALGNVLTNLIETDNETVRFAMTDGDITTKNDINTGNVISKVNALVKGALDKNKFQSKDLLSIIHLIDTDGAFVPVFSVQNNSEAAHIEYSETSIQTAHLDYILERNQKKTILIDKLRGKEEINKKPYKVFYFSRNMEHVFHNEIHELSKKEKIALADRFDDMYGDNPQDFLNFIRSTDFATQGDYEETWNFIKQGNHSLERWSNFHLYFEK